jgi:diguanylate cyclase (GGDEF)-like protein
MHLQRDPTRAETHLRNALDIFGRAGHPLGQGYALLNLTQLCIEAGRIQEARALLERTLRLSDHHDLGQVTAYALMHQGCLALEANELETAETLFLEACARVETRGDRPLAEAIPFMVDLYRRSNRLETARDLLLNHLEVVRERRLLPFELRAHELLTDVLEALGDVSGALRHCREHVRLFRQVHTADQEDKVRALEVLHRTQSAQRTAEEERRRNEELASALAQLEAMNRAVLEASLTDELTGLRNRRYLMRLETLGWSPQGFSVAVLDLDYFKAINDRHGHDGGDVVLKAFAALLQSELRPVDIVARFGGEEFVALLPNTSPETTRAVLHRVLVRSSARRWAHISLEEPLTFTAGVAHCADGNLLDALKRADQQLYRGKNAGRNGVWLEPTDPASTDMA